MYSISATDNKICYTDDIEKVSIEIPEESFAGLTGNSYMSAVDEEEYKKCICSPFKGKRLRDIAFDRNAKNACIIVSDATRNVPTKKVSGIIIKELQDSGIELSDIHFFVALGVHREATEEEMMTIIGEDLYSQVTIENHTPYESDNLINIGKTSFGTPVKVNKRAYECDIHISIGKVEPHEFAGFSGGRKSVLPGISSEETIISNHSVKMISSEKAVPGSMDGNPVSDDMIEAAELFRLDFCVNFVQNSQNETSALFSGPMLESHLSAVAYLRRYCKNIFTKPDIIVTTPGSPLNIDFYQSLKALIALTDVLDSSITVAFYCECREGINSPDMMKPFNDTSSLDGVFEYLTNNYKIQMDHSLLLTKILKKNVNIVVYSPNILKSDISKLHMTPSDSVEDMINKAIRICGKENPRILFYPQSQKSLPELSFTENNDNEN